MEANLTSVPSNGRIDFERLNNTRDLGGILTEEGNRIKPKKLLRSGMLSRATKSDLSVLKNDYSLQKVIDLRTTEERESNPDPMDALAGVEFVDIPLLSTETLGITREFKQEDMMQIIQKLAQDPIQLMVSIYPSMMTDKSSQAGLAQFFDEVLDEESGSVLWHCTAGKDRAGMAAFLLLRTLGVPHETAVGDYLATNRYMQESTQEILSAIASYNLPDQVRASIQVLNSADERFLQAALSAVDTEYGTLENFLREELDVTKDKKEALRARYLEA